MLPPEDLDKLIPPEDVDRRGIRLALNGIARRNCRDCSWDIFLYDLCFTIIMDSMKSRGIDSRAIKFYEHTYNGLRQTHCFYDSSLAGLDIHKPKT